MKKEQKKLFNYIVIIAVLIIPFMYSFFYLKAYWNPYGKGNIDNIPVAIVNEDEGDKGETLIESIIASEKLKISVVSSEEAEDGLYDKDYYAVITIPKDFTESMESAATNNKKHATITYSPNQKSNYLATQIINSVVNAVEKNLDNQVNSAIVESLSNSVEEVPTSLETISEGFSKLESGTEQLSSGSNELKTGALTLYNGTTTLANGVSSLKDGIYSLTEGTNSLVTGSQTLKDSTYKIYLGSEQISTAVSLSIENLKNDDEEAIDDETLTYIENEAVNSVSEQISSMFTDEYKNKIASQAVSALASNTTYQSLKSGISELEQNGITLELVSICTSESIPAAYLDACTNNSSYITSYSTYSKMITLMEETAKATAISTAEQTAKQVSSSVASQVSKSVAKQVATSAKETATSKTVESLTTLEENLSTLTSSLTTLYNGTTTLYNSIVKLDNGAQQLYDGAGTLNSGASTLNKGALSLSNGTNTLTSGITTLNNSVKSAKEELDSNIDTTKEEVKKVESLAEYAKEPVKVDTVAVNEVSSYGTAFSPLFISIGLWVGCLMMYVVLYYDKDKRFGILGKDDKRFTKRTLCYHGLVTISSIILGILLQLLLDFSITNVALYYLSIILIANLFTSIIDFLIINFNDVGKFLALIILVLQLAAAGGTFPIETVTKGFRCLNNILPMKYTIDLLKESLIAIESKLLIKNLIIVISIFLVFFIFNIINDKVKEKKSK